MNVNPLEQLPKKQSKKFFVTVSAILVIALIVIAGASGYFVGYEKGKAKGGELALKKIGDLVNPLNLLANNPVFPSTSIGKVTKVNDKQITVRLANGEERKAELTDKTLVTKKTDAAKLGDVKQNDQVTLMTRQENQKTVATRIIIN